MASMQSQRSGYRSSSNLSPTTIAGVVMVHAVLGAAILSMTHFVQVPPDISILWTRNIPAPTPVPKAEPVKPRQEPAKQESHVTATRPVIDLQPPRSSELVKPDPIILPSGNGTGTLPDILKPADPPTAPVMVQAKPDARFAGAFQPPYPAAMLRMQIEGKVTVRVTIGADGRVTDVALVSAIDPAFFEATKRQALSRWRFLPATRDGVPVPSERVMTVRFNLTD
ncbi:MAG TPA: TonB family protein [Sphingobium sp.]|uniref:energy transducer TonB n=1 Tax=Sphingobium sp. TaxID=1912891 RepID=UPI002ED1F736